MGRLNLMVALCVGANLGCTGVVGAGDPEASGGSTSPGPGKGGTGGTSG